MVILFDMYNLPDDIFEVIFATEQQTVVGRMLIQALKDKGGVLGKAEMSQFATRIHEGIQVEAGGGGPAATGEKKITVSYNKRQFYDRILTPMKSMGLIDYDLYKKVYRLSDKFNKNMVRVGLMWTKEVQEQKML
jgi:hypothetical protein